MEDMGLKQKATECSDCKGMSQMKQRSPWQCQQKSVMSEITWFNVCAMPGPNPDHIKIQLITKVDQRWNLKAWWVLWKGVSKDDVEY